MRVATMGRVVVKAKIENLHDLREAEQGRLPLEKVRTVNVEDAFVDTGATFLSVPRSFIEQLGIQRLRSRRSKTAAGVIEIGIYDVVRADRTRARMHHPSGRIAGRMSGPHRPNPVRNP